MTCFKHLIPGIQRLLLGGTALISAILPAAMTLGTSATAAAEVLPVDNSSWRIYSSFEAFSRRIIETEFITYFYVNQCIHNTTPLKPGETDKYVGYHTSTGAIFYYDERTPELGMRDLRERVPLSGTSMTYADYCQRSHRLVICYNDGLIDIVDDEGNVTTIRELSQHPLIAHHTVTNITFEQGNNDIWISTRGGYIHIDGKTYTAQECATWQQRVDAICRIGDRIVAIFDGKFKSAPLDCNLHDITNFKAMPIEAEGALNLLPLAANRFAYLANPAPGTMYEATCTDGEWSTRVLCSGNINQNASKTVNQPIANAVEHTFTSARDGYFFSSNKKNYLLRAGTEKAELDSLDRYSSGASAVGTYDMEKFWHCRDRGKFYRVQYTLGTDGKYTKKETGLIENDNNPIAFRQAQFRYHPDYGMLTMNVGTNEVFTNSTPIMPLTFSVYRDGQWKDLSPNHIKPTFYDELNDATKKLWNDNLARYPMGAPYGFEIDPVFKDWVFAGSQYDGVCAINIANPGGENIRFTNPGSKLINFPGNLSIFGPTPSWTTWTHSYVSGFDADGTLWMDVQTAWTSNDNLQKFLYWTVEDRRAALESQDVTKIEVAPRTLIINRPYQYAPNSPMSTVLKHPRNKNKLALKLGTNPREILIFDHKGTIDDDTDDTYVEFSRVRLASGGVTDFAYIYEILEDPNTGNLLVSSFRGVIEIDPCGQLSNGVMEGREVGVINHDETVTPLAPSNIVEAMCFDEYGRLWLGTMTSGVIGLSADRKHIVAEYYMANSPIPSDEVTGLCWNPETKELFISTAEGICTVRPDVEIQSAANGNNALMAVPMSVTPDYAGLITLYNVNPLCSLEVKNSEGKTIATLSTPVKSVAYWNLRDSDGKEVPAGIYTIHDISRIAPDVDITVVR